MIKALILLALAFPIAAIGQKVTETDIQNVMQLFQQGHKEEAVAKIDSLRKAATTKDQNYIMLLMTGAEFNMELFNWETAVVIQEELIQFLPEEEEDIQLNIGRLKKNLGDFKGAIAAYLRVLQLNPREEIVYNNLANTYNSAGQFQQAIETLNSNPATDRLAHEYYHYAVAYLNLHKVDSAKYFIDKYLQSEEASTDFIGYKTAAEIYNVLKDKKHACELVTKAVNILETSKHESELQNQPEKIKTTYLIRNFLRQIDETKSLKIKLCD